MHRFWLDLLSLRIHLPGMPCVGKRALKYTVQLIEMYERIGKLLAKPRVKTISCKRTRGLEKRGQSLRPYMTLNIHFNFRESANKHSKGSLFSNCQIRRSGMPFLISAVKANINRCLRSLVIGESSNSYNPY